MIKIKNMGEYILELATTGIQTTAAHGAGTTCSVIVPFAGRLKAVFARLGVAGVTSNQLTDLQVNGVSVLSSGSLFTFASGSVSPTYASNFVTNPPLFAKGDVLRIVTSQVNSGTAADDLSVLLTIERQRSGSWNDAVQTDTIGSDSDQI